MVTAFGQQHGNRINDSLRNAGETNFQLRTELARREWQILVVNSPKYGRAGATSVADQIEWLAVHIQIPPPGPVGIVTDAEGEHPIRSDLEFLRSHDRRTPAAT